MHSMRFAAFLAATLLGIATPALAGVKAVIDTKVERLADTVSYSKDGTTYKVGYRVTVSHLGGNNVNGVVFRGTTAVARRDGAPAPVNGPALFVEDDDVTCQSEGSPTISCALGRFRAGDAPRTFAVYFAAPVNAENINASEDPTIEVVKFSGATGYSEDTNDESGVPNDSSSFAVGDVSLGTPDPTNVQGAVSKQSGALLSTGPGDAVPKNETGSYQFAVKVDIPAAPVFTDATVQLKRFNATDNPTETQLCDAERNFYRCYESALTVPGLVFPVASSPANQKVVTSFLRIDTSEVRPGFKTRNVKVFYTDDSGFTDPNGLPRCADLPLSATTSHCVVGITRFGGSTPGGLANDVQVEMRGVTNGRVRIF